MTKMVSGNVNVSMSSWTWYARSWPGDDRWYGAPDDCMMGRALIQELHMTPLHSGSHSVSALPSGIAFY